MRRRGCNSLSKQGRGVARETLRAFPKIDPLQGRLLTLFPLAATVLTTRADDGRDRRKLVGGRTKHE